MHRQDPSPFWHELIYYLSQSGYTCSNNIGDSYPTSTCQIRRVQQMSIFLFFYFFYLFFNIVYFHLMWNMICNRGMRQRGTLTPLHKWISFDLRQGGWGMWLVGGVVCCIAEACGIWPDLLVWVAVRKQYINDESRPLVSGSVLFAQTSITILTWTLLLSFSVRLYMFKQSWWQLSYIHLPNPESSTNEFFFLIFFF